ncbi:hypothetical protein K469DRAFT_548438, partial [Zopfia rhizophila CBS 207.26]
YYFNNILFNYLNNFYIVYVNNILIYLNNPFKYNLYIPNIKKSKFNIISTKFLSFIISTNSIIIDPKKVLIVRD